MANAGYTVVPESVTDEAVPLRRLGDRAANVVIDLTLGTGSTAKLQKRLHLAPHEQAQLSVPPWRDAAVVSVTALADGVEAGTDITVSGLYKAEGDGCELQLLVTNPAGQTTTVRNVVVSVAPR